MSFGPLRMAMKEACQKRGLVLAIPYRNSAFQVALTFTRNEKPNAFWTVKGELSPAARIPFNELDRALLTLMEIELDAWHERMSVL